MPRVAQTIAQTLKAYGTEYFFIVTGGDQDLWIALDDAGIRLINCRSEKAATYMADGYARISGKPGFVYGQYGPGVSNVVAGGGVQVVAFELDASAIRRAPPTPRTEH